jgi:hypothetical protein
MKKAVLGMLVLALLNFCVPAARAEISQDLDPMVPVDFQAAVTEEISVSNTATGQASKGVSAEAATAGEKKAEKTKKEKTKKKSSVKKSKKSGPKNTCKNKNKSR